MYELEITRFMPSPSTETHTADTAVSAIALVDAIRDDEYVIIAGRIENGVACGDFLVWCNKGRACVRLNTDHSSDGTAPAAAITHGTETVFRDTAGGSFSLDLARTISEHQARTALRHWFLTGEMTALLTWT